MPQQEGERRVSDLPALLRLCFRLPHYACHGHRRGLQERSQYRIELGFRDFGDVGHETIVQRTPSVGIHEPKSAEPFPVIVRLNV